MGYISRKALENLHKYSYKGVDKSLTSKYILTPYWNWFVTLWPTSVAPNTITLSGLALVFINFLTLLYYDPHYLNEKGGSEGVPRWVYFSWAVGLFFYQSFDAIDGKQARRTGMAGPLGEMFDHGCDAMNTTLEAILTSYALNLGRSWWTVSAQVAALANFYLTTWEEYHTGQLYLGYFSGPVEGILMIVGLYIVTGFVGPTYWDTGVLDALHLKDNAYFVDVPNVAINEFFMMFGLLGLAANILASCMNVRGAVSSKKQSMRPPLARLFPFLISVSLQLAWLLPSSSIPLTSIFSNGSEKLLVSTTHVDIVHSGLFVPFICAWGLQFAHQVGRMILAHVTSTPFPMWDWIWAWSIVGAIDGNLPYILDVEPIIQRSHRATALFIYTTLALSFAGYGRFCALVINDITEYMGIACFTVRKKDKEGNWKEVNQHSKSD